jgi:hypothetical protein
MRRRAGARAAAALLLLIGVAVLALASFAAFRTDRLLFDAATPSVGLSLLSACCSSPPLRRPRGSESGSSAQWPTSGSAMRASPASSMRLATIQTSMLPRADLMATDRRLDIGASMVPARETGGDLYDYFLLDDRRFFFLAGDVAGKGLSASIFMAVSKALYKSATLRAQTTDIGLLMSAANAEVSRDNPQMLFRHGLRRDPGSRDRRARVLQRRARESIPGRSGEPRRAPPRGRRRAAALRRERLRLRRRPLRDASGRAALRRHRRRHGSDEPCGRALRKRARGGDPPSSRAPTRGHWTW